MASEHIEPAITHIIGQHFRLLTEAKKTGVKHKVEDACQNWWLGMLGINLTLITLEGFEHAKVAHTNEMRYVSKVIEDEIGYCPITTEPKRRGWDIEL